DPKDIPVYLAKPKTEFRGIGPRAGDAWDRWPRRKVIALFPRIRSLEFCGVNRPWVRCRGDEERKFGEALPWVFRLAPGINAFKYDGTQSDHRAPRWGWARIAAALQNSMLQRRLFSRHVPPRTGEFTFARTMLDGAAVKLFLEQDASHVLTSLELVACTISIRN